ncbi:hypothetical protein ACIQGZ_09230 [Streptomyces sp. NPDC092296]|uniref:hypothetical protein n=1 Tax=Streptomyces sp. NPDC092296 TaxID=3366012 RepID=UPI0038222FE5
MGSSSFQIDLTEVRTAARTIRRAVDDLDLATRNLEAAVQRVSAAHFGTDPLGRALQGESSGVGGLLQHQQRVVEGIRTYLRNSSKLSDNLMLMCDRHAENDAATASELRRIEGDAPSEPMQPLLAGVRAPGPEFDAVRPTPRIGTVVTDTPVTEAPTGTEPELTAYHDPDTPDLDYNRPPGPFIVGRAVGSSRREL